MQAKKRIKNSMTGGAGNGIKDVTNGVLKTGSAEISGREYIKVSGPASLVSGNGVLFIVWPGSGDIYKSDLSLVCPGRIMGVMMASGRSTM